ncbi:MAG: hypothetical protein RMK80_05035, partial [Pseudobdellovibrionaceae bacterium]|nr:hypothetical protein [Pseudobdellovibrionaceae bacterium]
MKNQSSWQQARVDLYLNLKSQCEAILGKGDGEILLYQKDYYKEFRRSWKPSSVNDLIASIQKAQIVLMGD